MIREHDREMSIWKMNRLHKNIRLDLSTEGKREKYLAKEMESYTFWKQQQRQRVASNTKPNPAGNQITQHRLPRSSTSHLNCVAYSRLADWDCYILTRLTRSQLINMSIKVQLSAEQLFFFWYRMRRYKTWEEHEVISGVPRQTLKRLWEESVQVLFEEAGKEIIIDGNNKRWTRNAVNKSTTNAARIVWQTSLDRLLYVMDGGYQHVSRVQSHNILFVCDDLYTYLELCFGKLI